MKIVLKSIPGSFSLANGREEGGNCKVLHGDSSKISLVFIEFFKFVASLEIVNDAPGMFDAALPIFLIGMLRNDLLPHLQPSLRALGLFLSEG